MAKMIIRWCGIFLLSVVGTGCVATPDAAPTATIDPQARIAAHLATVQQAHAEAISLWDQLIAGEPVSCQRALPVPPALTLSAAERQADPAAEAIVAHINQASDYLRVSSELWDGECAHSGEYVALVIAREGRVAARRAGDSLAEAQRLIIAANQ
jgi:hypothetical protein